MNRIIPLLLLAACTSAGADEVRRTERDAQTPHPIAEAVRVTPVLDDEALSQVDVRGTARTATLVLRDVESQSPERNRETRESYRVLSVTCPYTRASILLALALNQAVQQIDAEDLDPLVQADWATLQGGLATHVAVLDALGADLPLPERGDALFRSDPATRIDRATLRATADPIQAALPLLAAVPRLVDDLDDAAMDRIREHSHVVQRNIGHGWTFRAQLVGWHKALRRMEPFVVDPRARTRVRAMIEATGAYADQGC